MRQTRLHTRCGIHCRSDVLCGCDPSSPIPTSTPLQSFIVDSFGFPPENIRTLTDEKGSGNELPTRVG